MKATLLITLALAAPLFSAADGSVAAVQKVIQMLTDMSATVKKEKANEEIAYATFSTWCTQESAGLKKSIAKSEEHIELLGAEIDKLIEEAATLKKEIHELTTKLATAESDIKAATGQRKKDNSAFLVEEQDYSESVDAIDRALIVLNKQDYDRPGTAAALLQVSDRVPAEAKSLIASFLGMMSNKGDGEVDQMAYEAPEANAYEFQSGSLITLLKRLQDEFRGTLSTCQKEEMNSKHAYEMVIQDLTDIVENAKTDIPEKQAQRERKVEKTALDKKERFATQTAMRDDEATLADMKTACHEKQLSFEEKQQLRMDEIEAIGKAIVILKSPAVSGNAKEHLGFAQLKVSTSFVQVHADETTPVGARHHVRDFLANEARRLRSKGLGLLAEKMSANPFAKVKKLIDDMITRLLEEANSDAKHEGFCDKEMGQSKITRNKLSEDIDQLTAAIEDGKATTMTLAEDLKRLAEEVAALDVLMKEATAQRQAEKKKNAATVEDAKAAQEAVAAATAVLKDFYEQASVATALVQGGKPGPIGRSRGVKMGTEEWDALANPNFKGTIDPGHKGSMQTFGETYSGKQDEAGGVLALMEVIASDFANLQSDTESAEAASQKAYDDLMAESKKNKAAKLKKTEMNSADKAAAETRLQDDIFDLKATQDKLLAADRYYERLVPQCIDQGMTFEERTKAREEEIASLKQALDILNRDDIATSA